MMRDITLGQYYPENSVIHRLDPRTKLFGTMIFMICLFLNDSFSGYIGIMLFFFIVLRLSRVPFSYLVKGLKPVWILILFTAVLNLFMTEGDALINLFGLKITYEGIKKAVFYSIRIVFLVLGSSIMTLTTTPTSLTDGLERSLGFLNYIKVPVHDMAMMMSIALRFIPILTEELDKIMKAQISRGADFETGGIIKRAASLVPLLVPLLISAFHRAGDLAMAMDARCYNGSTNRTKLHPLRYNRADHISYIILVVYLLIIVIWKII